jgi:hypothetical protein
MSGPATTEPTGPYERVEGRRVTPVKVLLGLLVVGMIAMWVYALGPWARQDPPGRLDDPAFAAEAEPVCAAAVDELAALPQAFETTTPEARATAIDETNVVLSAMVVELRTFAPTTGVDGERVGEWLDDWDTYIEDRANLATQLREDGDARLHETAKGDDHISEALDFFAVTANDMPSCATPDDIS